MFSFQDISLTVKTKTSYEQEVEDRSIINLTTMDYEKIAELQTKFDKFNAMKSISKDREISVAKILSSMEVVKMQELRAKFESMSNKKLKASHEIQFVKEVDSTQDLRALKKDEFKNTRRTIEENMMKREMTMLRKKLEMMRQTPRTSIDNLYIERRFDIDYFESIARTSFDLNLFSTSESELEISSLNNTVEGSFKNLNKQLIFFSVWRIENNGIVQIPRSKQGAFYNNECYIIYAASQYGQASGPHIVPREIRSALEYHIHFWLGKFTTVDKAGAAAYKATELDMHIGNVSTQHREYQSKESARFKSYFTQGIRVLCQNDSPSKAELMNLPRLFRVKGTRSPMLTQMQDITWGHFNSSDVFILHIRLNLFIWIGRSASAIDKTHATKVANQLKTDYKLENLIFVDDGYEKTLPEENVLIFDQFLPLNKRVVKIGDEVEEESDSEKFFRKTIKLYQCEDINGKYRISEIKSGPLQQNDLRSEYVMILDHGIQGIWVWVGKHASLKERCDGIKNARGFVKKKKYPQYTPITRVIDELEPIEFKSLFVSWEDRGNFRTFSIFDKNPQQKMVVKITRYDAVTMNERPLLAAKSQLIDDGVGNIKIWRVKYLDTVEIPSERIGVFFTGDCYIILYSYKINTETRWMIYFWLGHHSVPDEQGIAIMKATELDNTVTNKNAMVTQVWQGREPSHFLQLFKGRMRVFNGNGTDYDVSGKNLKSPNHYLLHIQGTATFNTKATQMPLKASSLNSYNCFVLRKINTYYIWCGNQSTGDNREMAKGYVGVDFMLLLEGNETPDFWSALCGKQTYSNKKLPEKVDNSCPPRLFRCYKVNDRFKTEEIMNYTQQDLDPEDVMLLDAYYTVYLWIGKCSNKDDKKVFYDMGLEYLHLDPRGRDPKTSISLIKQHFEPPTFIGFFPNWDHKFWKDHKCFEEIRNELEEIAASTSKRTYYSYGSEFDSYNKYPIPTLKGLPEQLPSSVDPLKKELHLTYDDFVSIFNMEYQDFQKLPLWKQQEMKKLVGLF